MALGQIRQGPGFTMTVRNAPRPPSAPASGASPASTQATNPYGGFDPNTIDIAPFQKQMEFLQQQSMDPQGELRAREEAALTERVRAGQAARGLLPAGVGAAQEGEALADFALDWQNQQLQRGLAGAQGMYSMGGLMQNVANQGWQHQQDLGASAFEYEPDTSPMSSVTFHPGGSSSYGTGAGSRATSSFLNSESPFAARRREAQANADRLNQQNMMRQMQQQMLEEQQRQFNEAMAFQQRRYNDARGDMNYRSSLPGATAASMNAIAPGGGGYSTGKPMYGPTFNQPMGGGRTRYHAQRLTPGSLQGPLNEMYGPYRNQQNLFSASDFGGDSVRFS